MFTLSTRQEIEDFTQGCCFFATGGGGDPKFGQKMLMEALEAGKEIRIVEANDIDDNGWIACPYLMGTSGAETEAQRKIRVAHGLSETTVSNMPAAATKLLLKQHPEKISLAAIIPYEIGAAATSSAVATAAWLDIPTIDADFVGRAVPEITQMLPVVHGIELSPTASADAYGNEVIVHKTLNYQMTERIGKALASASFGLVGQATLLHQAKKLKPFMLNKTLSRALMVGKAIRTAQEQNTDLMSKLSELLGSKVLLEGVISKFNDGEKDGYYTGDIIIDGTGTFKGSQLKIWFKNENLIAWLNDNLLVSSPDLISLIDKPSQAPLINNKLKVGLNIVVVGTPCHKEWHAEKALKIMDPRYFGFDFDAKTLY